MFSFISLYVKQISFIERQCTSLCVKVYQVIKSVKVYQVIKIGSHILYLSLFLFRIGNTTSSQPSFIELEFNEFK